MNQLQSNQTERILFVFLEIFSCEGGIQTYVKDILSSYQVIVEQAVQAGRIYQTDIVLLRDGQTCNNPFDAKFDEDFISKKPSKKPSKKTSKQLNKLESIQVQKLESFDNSFAEKSNLTTQDDRQIIRQNSTQVLSKSSLAFQFYYLKTRQPNLGRLRCVLRLFWQCLMHRPTQIICGHVNLAPLVRSLSQLFKIPYVVMTYGKEVWQPLPSAQQQALRHAEAIWTISRYSRDQAAISNQLDRDRFQMLPCVINGATFYPAPKPQVLLDRYQLHGARVLMTVARLWSGDIYKGVDVTLRALPEICQVFPDVKYLIIGRGDDRPRLEQLAADLGILDQVIFAGFVPTEELPDHYRVADAYVMPSQEGFGIVYLEAMATGIPVLSGDNDGSADPLQDGRLGWQVPHRDPQAVAQACIEMLQGADRRCDGNWLRSETLAAFGHAAIADRLRTLLRR